MKTVFTKLFWLHQQTEDARCLLKLFVESFGLRGEVMRIRPAGSFTSTASAGRRSGYRRGIRPFSSPFLVELERQLDSDICLNGITWLCENPSVEHSPAERGHRHMRADSGLN
jgi:hypothetical protein